MFCILLYSGQVFYKFHFKKTFCRVETIYNYYRFYERGQFLEIVTVTGMWYDKRLGHGKAASNKNISNF